MSVNRRMARAWVRASAGCVLALFAALPVIAQTTAVEYYHAGWGHYFITAAPNEQAALDSGTLAGWTRTGERFAVDGSADVCRFFTAQFAGKGSHFYTPYPAECDTLRAGSVWTYEGLVFRLDLPDANGACRAASRRLYRLYNEGLGGAPNHRYTVSPDLVSAMRAQGWKSEGVGADPVFACVPDTGGGGGSGVGPSGNWRLDRVGGCNTLPVGCSDACPASSLNVAMTESASGSTIALVFPDGGHPSQTLDQGLASPYHQAYSSCEQAPGYPIPGGRECAAAVLDLPNRVTGVFQITRTLSGTGGAASCTVWSAYLGAKQ